MIETQKKIYIYEDSNDALVRFAKHLRGINDFGIMKFKIRNSNLCSEDGGGGGRRGCGAHRCCASAQSRSRSVLAMEILIIVVACLRLRLCICLFRHCVIAKVNPLYKLS